MLVADSVIIRLYRIATPHKTYSGYSSIAAAGSVSGFAWTFLQPIAQLAIFAFVFSQIFRAGVPANYTGVTYTAFVAVALWPWIMFSEGVQRGMAAVAGNAGLIRKVALPTQLLVYSTVIACYAINLAGFVVVLLVLFATVLPATCGLAFVGTLYGGLAAGTKGRETLLPLLLFPVVAPVLIGATRATEAALGAGGAATSEGWPWIGLLMIFAALFGVGGTLAFGPLIEE